MKLYLAVDKSVFFYAARGADLVGLPRAVLCSFANKSGAAFVLSQGVDTFLDSGAYSIYTSGIRLSVKDYYVFLKQFGGFASQYANFDRIGDWDKTRENLRFLESLGMRPLPVFHMGTPFRILESLCDKYNYICLGGMVPHAKDPSMISTWADECFKIASRYKTRFHGFGCSSYLLMSRFPWYSVDSSSWLFGGGKTGVLTLFDKTLKSMVKISLYNRTDARVYRRVLLSWGIDPSRIARKEFFDCKYIRAQVAASWYLLGKLISDKHGGEVS